MRQAKLDESHLRAKIVAVRRKRMSFQVAIVISVIALSFTGCSTTGKHVRWYEGPPRPANEIALLKIQRELFKNSAIVQSINGTDIRKGKSLSTAREIEFNPGTYAVEFTYVGSNGGVSVTNATLTFTALAGDLYELHVAPIDDGVGKAFSRALSGGNFYWTAWIIDAGTKKILAGESREEPLRWYE